MNIPPNRRFQPGKLLAGAALLVLAAAFLLPFLWLLATAFKTERQIFSFPPSLLPSPISLENFRAALGLMDFPLLLRNSLAVGLLTTTGSVITSSLIGFGLASLPARGKHAIYGLMLATIVIPPAVTIVPQFVLMSRLGWVNTYLPLVLTPVFGNVIYILLFRQFFKTLPPELFESAELEGSSPVSTYLRIGLPLAKPVLILVAVFAFIGSWNDFLAPLVYLSTQDRYTLSLGLSFFQSARQSQLHYLMPVSFLAVLPIALLFLFSQRFLDTNVFGRFEL